MVFPVAGIRAWSAAGSGAAGAVSVSVSVTNEAKDRPATSLITVTEDGVAGRGRDHFTFTAPIFGRLRRPPPVTFQRAFAVNRTDRR